MLLTTAAALDDRDAAFAPGDLLRVGRESAGAPLDVHAVAAATVLGEALRQLR